jgi:hypothetical protein
MSYINISIEELNDTLNMIHYLNGKIRERSRLNGRALDGISEDMIHSLSEYFDVEGTATHKTKPAKAA